MMVYTKATEEHIPGIAQVHIESWKTTYQDLFPPDIFESKTPAVRQAQWRGVLDMPQRHLWVAMEQTGEQVMGFACGGPFREEAYPCQSEISAIYLLQSAQGQGVGKGLLQHVLPEVLAAYGPDLGIWVAKENPIGCGFYDALGGQRESDKEVIFSPQLTVQEWLYRWKNGYQILEK